MIRDLAILSLLATQAQAAKAPTQGEMNALLQNAGIVWGQKADIAGIQFAFLNDCRKGTERAGWSDLASRMITINSACKWTTETLWVAVLHEYGHMAYNSAFHSQDPHSVMFWRLAPGQQITPEDREWLADKRRLERPTIMLAREEGE